MGIKKIAIFASGTGSNAQNIIEYFADSMEVTIDSVWSNNAKAHALTRAAGFGIETFVFSRHELNETQNIVEKLQNRKIDLIVLAGFLWLMPVNLTRNFTVINIHPALLPKYGGKGMYGMKVHQAVIDNKETRSGISIHYVNENYDEGKIILQEICEVQPTDTAEDLAAKVHALEYEFFPKAIEMVLSTLV
jgi:phosphoribosylglycinamide formyltransferase-1